MAKKPLSEREKLWDTPAGAPKRKAASSPRSESGSPVWESQFGPHIYIKEKR